MRIHQTNARRRAARHIFGAQVLALSIFSSVDDEFDDRMWPEPAPWGVDQYQIIIWSNFNLLIYATI